MELVFPIPECSQAIDVPCVNSSFERILSLAYVNVARWFPSAFVDHIFNLAEPIKNAFAIYLGGGSAIACFLGGLCISFR